MPCGILQLSDQYTPESRTDVQLVHDRYCDSVLDHHRLEGEYDVAINIYIIVSTLLKQQ